MSREVCFETLQSEIQTKVTPEEIKDYILSERFKPFCGSVPAEAIADMIFDQESTATEISARHKCARITLTRLTHRAKWEICYYFNECRIWEIPDVSDVYGKGYLKLDAPLGCIARVSGLSVRTSNTVARTDFKDLRSLGEGCTQDRGIRAQKIRNLNCEGRVGAEFCDWCRKCHELAGELCTKGLAPITVLSDPKYKDTEYVQQFQKVQKRIQVCADNLHACNVALSEIHASMVSEPQSIEDVIKLTRSVNKVLRLSSTITKSFNQLEAALPSESSGQSEDH